MNKNRFPNGFESWHETHFLVSQFIIGHNEDETGIISDIKKRHGSTALFELAKEWTDEIELKNYANEWKGEFLSHVNEFLISKLNE
jgi:mRNA deadenylase 3'-5' endonuclease subunit Ccr4